MFAQSHGMWRANGLSIVLTALFLTTLLGHSLAGWRFNNEELVQHGRPELTYSQYVRSGEFMESVAENWESEFLQMAAYVVLTIFLRQKGSSESKKLDEKEKVDEDPAKHQKSRNAPSPVRAGGWKLALYKNSLSLAFVLLFLISFIAHAAGGARDYNEEQAEHGSPERVSWVGYMGTSRFWYESFQNWQSEFLAVLSIVTLSIFLRQYGSPESKPVHAPHDATGKD
jgi:hypothetical protein